MAVAHRDLRQNYEQVTGNPQHIFDSAQSDCDQLCGLPVVSGRTAVNVYPCGFVIPLIFAKIQKSCAITCRSRPATAPRFRLDRWPTLAW